MVVGVDGDGGGMMQMVGKHETRGVKKGPKGSRGGDKHPCEHARRICAMYMLIQGA